MTGRCARPADSRRGGGLLLSALCVLLWELAPGTFVLAPLRTTSVRQHSSSLRWPVSLANVAAIAALRADPAIAEEPESFDVGKQAQKAFNLVTKGAEEAYDPTTEEGAKALGLAYPIPKKDDLPGITPEDFLPLVGIFVVACIWGIFVVPSFMERADGTKTTLFPEKEKDDGPPVDKVLAAAPVVVNKRLSKAPDDEDIPSKLPKGAESQRKKRRTGFGNKRKR
mmetsp:Transcript_84704/g.196940  ORF Transcript_84704/g.196940 Transcript_84704/m.196940 type:complete len:225 (-) Transcript_84704:46-720(-)